MYRRDLAIDFMIYNYFFMKNMIYNSKYEAILKMPLQYFS